MSSVPPEPIRESAIAMDMSPRMLTSVAVVGSPAAAAETIVCTVAVPASIAVVSGVFLLGWAALTVGTNGTAITVRIRQTNVAGAVIATSGALTGGIAAAGLVAPTIFGLDTAPPAAGVYVLTVQVTAGSAVSTVSGTQLIAIAV